MPSSQGRARSKPVCEESPGVLLPPEAVLAGCRQCLCHKHCLPQGLQPFPTVMVPLIEVSDLIRDLHGSTDAEASSQDGLSSAGWY